MEYHQDRFEDFSLMIYKDELLLAILPANRCNQDLYSHQGLTYGGLLFMDSIDEVDKTMALDKAIQFLKSENLKTLMIKTLPQFYYPKSSDVFEYALTNYESSVMKNNRVMAIDYQSDFKIHKTKLKRFKKFDSNGFRIEENESEFEPFWNSVLIPRLNEKHDTKPVHSLSEMLSLKKKFPKNIFQFNIYDKDEILAGITIFKKGDVVKSQYGIASSNGEKNYALDMLFVYLIQMYKDEGMHYFSMGTVNDDSAIGYNKGMLKQKQEFGCKTYIQQILK